jgi:hypothetical protein
VAEVRSGVAGVSRCCRVHYSRVATPSLLVRGGIQLIESWTRDATERHMRVKAALLTTLMLPVGGVTLTLASRS